MAPRTARGGDGLDEAVRDEARAEVALVERATEDGFVDALQLGEREARRHQLEGAEAHRIVKALLKSVARAGDELRVVERELLRATRRTGREGDLTKREPPYLRRANAGHDRVRLGDDERKEDDGDRVPSRIARGRTERAELLERNALHARLPKELACRGLIETVVTLDETARQRPLPFEGSARAPHEHDGEILGAHREEHDVGGDGGPRLVVAVRHGRRWSCPSDTKSNDADGALFGCVRGARAGQNVMPRFNVSGT